MIDEQSRCTDPLHALQMFPALFLEESVPHRHDFVEEVHIGLYMRDDGECEPHLHPHAVALQGKIPMRGNAGKCDDAFRERVNLTSAQAVKETVEIDVFDRCPLRVEADGEIEEA